MADGNRRLDLTPFRVDSADHIATAEIWNEWIDDFERQLRYFRITDDEDKLDALIIYGGPEIKRLNRSLEDPKIDGTKYTKVVGKLSDYFVPKKNIHYSRYLFFKMRPTVEESTVAYAARLRDKALQCDFIDTDNRILEHLIQTTSNTEFVRRAIHRKWTLQEALSDAQISDSTSIQLEAMNHQALDIDRIHRKKKMYSTSSDTSNNSNSKHRCCKSKHQVYQDRHTISRRKRSDRRPSDYTDNETSSSSEEESIEFINAVKTRTKQDWRRQKRVKKNNTSCGYCGRFQVHARKEHCIAYGEKCYSCNKWHHIAKVCKSVESDFNKHTMSRKNRIHRRGTSQRRISDFSSSDESDHSMSSLAPNVKHISIGYDLIGNGFTVDESEDVCAFQEKGVSSILP